MRFLTNFCVASSSLLLCLACAQSAQTSRPQPPVAGPDGEYLANWPDLGKGEERYITIELGDAFQTCRHLSPKFPFDSARTRAQDRMQLRALASCLNHPSMADRRLLLVGRADERGSPGYNQQLGMQRAERIQQLLIQDGVPAGRIELDSKGETGALGAEPGVSFGYDRRVDIVVTGGVHSPGPPPS